MNDPQVEKIARKVVVEPEPTQYWPHNKTWAGSVEVVAMGKRFSAYSDTVKGDSSRPETTMTDDELKNKCRNSLKEILKDEQIEELIETCYSLEKIDDLSILTKLIIL